MQIETNVIQCEVDPGREGDSLQDLHNSSHHMKAEFNNRFIIHLEISTLPPDNPGRLSSNIGLFNWFQDINVFFVQLLLKR